MQQNKHKMYRAIDDGFTVHHWSCAHCGLSAWLPEDAEQLESNNCDAVAVDIKLHALQLAIRETRQHLSLSITFMGLMAAAAIVAAILRDLI